ncbi:3'-5' exoribonuclease [Acholeplasma morum]|uniref:HD domain-containing protein n=1 Tax=Paracholeplasma morum TaxID=264637 RepID=UPI00195C4A4D|nr:HD domain-containing protein [Paracholeplasma morum]MBM7452849.1 3'-5' exoribonuclease [Paracholeplasma morum]
MEFNAKVETMNVGVEFQNINVLLKDGEKKNLKLDQDQLKRLELGKTYHFTVETYTHNEKEQLKVVDFVGIFEHIKDPILLKLELASFYEYAPIDMKVLKDSIQGFLDQLENETIKKITKGVYQEYENSFYMYPAAVRFHHAYIGGLAYHTKTMIDIAMRFKEIYPYLNKDLLIAGILLHDICKVDELNGFEGGEYTLEGQLVGHLVLGAMKIKEMARKLDLVDKEEVLMLTHILLSHHGLPNFGAAKKPMTPEAILIWYIDTIDSKFTVLGEELAKTDAGDFTQSIPVLDKSRVYKHKF